MVTFALLGLAQRGIWVVMLPIYLVTLTPEHFGILLLLTFTASVVAVPANLKLDAAVRTFFFDYTDDDAARRDYLRQILTASVISALLIYGLILVLGETVFEWLFEHDEMQFYPLAPIAVATACSNACIAPYLVYLRNALLLRELVRVQLSMIVGNVLLQVILMVVLGLGIYGALLGALIPSLIVLTYVVTTQSGLAPTGLRRAVLEPSLKYSAPLIVFSLFYLLETRLDTIVLEHHIDLRQLGAYAMLISIIGLLVFALNAIDNALRCVRRGGKMIAFGLSRNNEVPFRRYSQDVVFGGITVKGIIGRKIYDTWYKTRALTARPDVREKIQTVVTDVLPFADWNIGFEKMARRESGKVVLRLDL